MGYSHLTHFPPYAIFNSAEAKGGEAVKDPGILKDEHFEELTEVRPDTKNRISLGKMKPARGTTYKVYCNYVGQIILDPQVAVPAYEAWLFKNPKAAQQVRQGLKEAREGRLTKAKEDYTKYLKDSD